MDTEGGGHLTTTTEEAVTLAVHPERPPGLVTREMVARAIANESRFGVKRALRFVDSIREGVRAELLEGEDTWWPGDEWLSVHHEMLCAIAPDHAISQPGTAHALLEDHVLDHSKGQLGLTHDMAPQPGGQVSNCCVQIIARTFDI